MHCCRRALAQRAQSLPLAGLLCNVLTKPFGDVLRKWAEMQIQSRHLDDRSNRARIAHGTIDGRAPEMPCNIPRAGQFPNDRRELTKAPTQGVWISVL